MKIKTLILTVLIFGFNQLFGQDFSNCKVDFFLLESQESFSTDDNGREYIINFDNIPNYEIKEIPSITLEQAKSELSEKLQENKDYNKNNPQVRDSLIEYYSELAHNIGVKLIWWENRQRKEKRIRDDVPIFWIQPKGNTLKVSYDSKNSEYTFPKGITPIFDLHPYQNSKIVLHNENQGSYSEDWKKLEFILDDNTVLSVYNYKFKQGYYQPTKDLSIDIFYDKKKLEKINEFLNSLKTKNLIIQADGEEYINPTILNFRFGFSFLDLTFSNNGKTYTKTFKGYPDPNYSYDNGWPDKRAKLIFDLPIYFSDCYNKKLEGFNSLTLKNDYFSDPELRQILHNALTSSPDWINFKIERVILTIKSQWVVVTNRYTGFKESRFILADVYIKSLKTGKCYLQKEVYFNQKLDPYNEYTYSIFVSVPQNLEPYPCNLK